MQYVEISIVLLFLLRCTTGTNNRGKGFKLALHVVIPPICLSFIPYVEAPIYGVCVMPGSKFVNLLVSRDYVETPCHLNIENEFQQQVVEYASRNLFGCGKWKGSGY
ncbi:unnamed protein product [Ilex paraguariensis]|uniref:Secreted protein n=1 Tax=Ilex paraguariensis TaxID=185542 RepID=A0ABC8QM94_9AQUA